MRLKIYEKYIISIFSLTMCDEMIHHVLYSPTTAKLYGIYMLQICIYFTTVYKLYNLRCLASEFEIDHLLTRTLAFCAYNYEINDETQLHEINHIRERKYKIALPLCPSHIS